MVDWLVEKILKGIAGGNNPSGLKSRIILSEETNEHKWLLENIISDRSADFHLSKINDIIYNSGMFSESGIVITSVKKHPSNKENIWYIMVDFKFDFHAHEMGIKFINELIKTYSLEDVVEVCPVFFMARNRIITSAFPELFPVLYPVALKFKVVSDVGLLDPNLILLVNHINDQFVIERDSSMMDDLICVVYTDRDIISCKKLDRLVDGVIRKNNRHSLKIVPCEDLPKEPLDRKVELIHSNLK